MPVVSAQQLESVRDQIDDGLEVLDGSLRGSWQVHHERVADRSGPGPGERGHGSRFETTGDHRVNEAGRLPLENGGSRLRSHISEAESGPSGGEDQTRI